MKYPAADTTDIHVCIKKIYQFKRACNFTQFLQFIKAPYYEVAKNVRP